MGAGRVAIISPRHGRLLMRRLNSMRVRVIWVPVVLLVSVGLALCFLWILSDIFPIAERRRDLLDGGLGAGIVIVVSASLLIAFKNKSWVALLPVFPVIALFLLRAVNQRDPSELKEIGRLQNEEYLAKDFGVIVKDGKIVQKTQPE